MEMEVGDSGYRKYVQVILPLAIDRSYTYGVPDEFLEQIQVGMRVEVQFGKRRSYGGLVRHILDADVVSRAKPILALLDNEPIVNEMHFRFWEWLSEYYMCPIGAIMIAALPSALKLSSETKVRLHGDFEGGKWPLNAQEDRVVEALENRKEMNLLDIRELLEKKQVYLLVKSMLEREILEVSEKLKNQYKEKKENFIKLSEDFQSEDAQGLLFEELEKKAPRQLQILISYFSLSRRNEFVKVSQVVKKVEGTNAAVDGLVKKGVFVKEKMKVDRLDDSYDEIIVDYRLTDAQEKAKAQVKERLSNKSVCLIHGVTASGKTAIYIEFIREAIAEGKTALFLLPEIALTSQMIHRLRKVFGAEVGIYHSRFNPNEKVEIWQKVLNGQYKLLVGARSALFLPFQNLGLVIVDEEHDPSYKQKDPAPRYQARDAVIYLAMKNKAKVILGSATPSVESYYNAQKGKYGLVNMTERYGGGSLPEIELVDLQAAKRKNKMSAHFSWDLLEAIKETLDKKEQVILFKNRRGYSPFVECSNCNWVPSCERCDVSLTYHKYANDLKCHYCGFRIALPALCHECNHDDVSQQGFGTEQIEEEIKKLLPEVQVGRLDLETTRSKTSFNQIIGAFEQGDLQILVGTQMVTKGLDFHNVGLVGVMGADDLLNFPDFRSTERAFQLMIQVSGRAGRRKKQGRVLIQTHQPKHPVYQFVQQRNYGDFFRLSLEERQQWGYPPFLRVIHLRVKHREIQIVNEGSLWLARNLEKDLPRRVLGPAVPAVSRIRNMYLRDILIKLPPKGDYISQCKRWIAEVLRHMKKSDPFKSVVVHADVDP